jgi:hypothetical protein
MVNVLLVPRLFSSWCSSVPNYRRLAYRSPFDTMGVEASIAILAPFPASYPGVVLLNRPCVAKGLW